MKITKFGHSCVLLDDGKSKILFDPGVFSEFPEDLSVDAVIITHAHQDHLDIGHLQKILKNRKTRIITNNEVGAELETHNLEFELVEEGNSVEVGDFHIEGVGNEHAVIHSEMPRAQNTGYLVNGKIFHPGDSLIVPPSQIDVLLLPVAAPWSKISETIDYIREVKPKTCFPIHDAFLTAGGQSMFYRMSGLGYKNIGAEFIEAELNKEYELSI